jgi:quinol monooxygenase YgiN
MRSKKMSVKLALFVRLEAKPGKEAEVAEFLKVGVSLSEREPLTPIWFALQFSESTFGVFDAFEDEEGRQAHLTGQLAQTLMGRADELFVRPPTIERVDVLGLKNVVLVG